MTPLMTLYEQHDLPQHQVANEIFWLQMTDMAGQQSENFFHSIHSSKWLGSTEEHFRFEISEMI